NRALRKEDIELLYKFRYFISDLCKNLEREYQQIKEYGTVLTLCHGVRMSTEEVKKLKENIDNLISANGFLSTSLSKDVALRFAGAESDKEQSVLFEIGCNLATNNL
ncbi:unnamed protein product, partial [Didymodactylos carnosus]